MADDFDDLNFDSFESDFENLDIDPSTSKGRKPNERATQLLSSMFNGVKEGVPGGLAAEIRLAMPKTSMAMDRTLSFVDEMASMKQNFTKDLRPTLTTIKQASRKLLPNVKNMMPAGIYKKLEGALATPAKTPTKSLEQMKSESESTQIADTLSGIFNAQQQQMFASKQDEKAAQYIQMSLEKSRHSTNLDAFGKLYDQLSFQSNFIGTTFTAWLKKDLELKYRHLFVAKDTFALMKTSMQVLDNKLADIVHNTGLPNETKLHQSDLHKSIFRNKAATSFTDFIGGYGKKFLNKVKTEALGKIVSGVKGAAGTLTQLADASDMASSMGMDVDVGNAGIGLGGGLLGNILGSSIGRKALGMARPLLNEIEGTSGGIRERAIMKIDDLRQKWEGEIGTKGFLASFLPRYEKDVLMDNHLLNNAEDTTPFDVATRTSIVEIIPGYLASIDKLVRDIKTGTENEERIYDAVSRDFVSVSELRENIFTRAMGDKASRGRDIATAVGAAKAGFLKNAKGDDTSSFDNAQNDIAKVVANLAMMKKYLDMDRIRAFLASDPTDEVRMSAYVEDLTKGIADPRATLMVLREALTLPSGAIDGASLDNFNQAVMRQMKNEDYKKVLPRMFETLGHRRHFKGDIDQDTGYLKRESIVSAQLDMDEAAFADMIENSTESSINSTAQRERDRKALRGLIKKFGKDGALDALGEMATKVSKTKIPYLNRLAQLLTNRRDLDITQLKDRAAAAAASVKQRIGAATGQAKDRASDLWDNVKNGGMMGAMQEQGGDLLNRSREFVEQVKSDPSGMAQAVVKTVKDRVTETMETLESDESVKRIVSVVSAVNKKMLDELPEVGGTSSPMDGEAVTSNTSTILDLLSDMFEHRKEADSAILSAIANIGGVIGGEGSEAATRASKLGAVFSTAKGAGKGILSAYTKIYSSAFKAGGSIASSTINKVGDLATAVSPEILKLIGMGGKGAVDITKAYLGMYGKMGSAIASVFTKGKKKKEPYVSIYLKGRIDPGRPLLSKRKQEEEGVIFQDGSRVKHSYDITEPVFDPETHECLITEEDIKRGLVDVNGKPITDGGQGAGGVIGSLFKSAGSLVASGAGLGKSTMDLYYDLIKKGTDLGVSGIKGVGNFLFGKKRRNDDDPIITRMDKMLDALLSIEDMFAEFLDGSDGGSGGKLSSGKSRSRSSRKRKDDRSYIERKQDELKDKFQSKRDEWVDKAKDKVDAKLDPYKKKLQARARLAKTKLLSKGKGVLSAARNKFGKKQGKAWQLAAAGAGAGAGVMSTVPMGGGQQQEEPEGSMLETAADVSELIPNSLKNKLGQKLMNNKFAQKMMNTGAGKIGKRFFSKGGRKALTRFAGKRAGGWLRRIGGKKLGAGLGILGGLGGAAYGLARGRSTTEVATDAAMDYATDKAIDKVGSKVGNKVMDKVGTKGLKKLGEKFGKKGLGKVGTKLLTKVGGKAMASKVLAKAGPLASLAATGYGAYEGFAMDKKEAAEYAKSLGEESQLTSTLLNGINPVRQGKIIAATVKDSFGLLKDYSDIADKEKTFREGKDKYVLKQLDRMKQEGAPASLIDKFIATEDPRDQQAIYAAWIQQRRAKKTAVGSAPAKTSRASEVQPAETRRKMRADMQASKQEVALKQAAAAQAKLNSETPDAIKQAGKEQVDATRDGNEKLDKVVTLLDKILKKEGGSNVLVQTPPGAPVPIVTKREPRREPTPALNIKQVPTGQPA